MLTENINLNNRKKKILLNVFIKKIIQKYLIFLYYINQNINVYNENIYDENIAIKPLESS